MEKQEKKFIPCGPEWEAEVMKMTKKDIVGLLRKQLTGTVDSKLCGIHSREDAQHHVEGILNDFEGGIISKDEALRLMGAYTGRLEHIFWKRAKEIIRENPEYLKD